MTKIAACYARYSTDIQNDNSIDDQILLNKQLADRYGCTIPEEFIFTDRAKSSDGILDRPGILALLRGLKERKFEAVIVEDLHRVSRDGADLLQIKKHMDFAEAQFINLNGPVSDFLIYIRSIVGHFQLQDIKNTIRRQRNARVHEGLVAGPFTYGYRNVEGGKRGQREVLASEAAIVVRIFTEYANGKSPFQIIADLNRDDVPCPSARMPKRAGTRWSISIFKGRGSIISNPLYSGKIVWNRYRRVKNPDNDRKQARANKPEDIKIIDAPHLRIVDQNLFDRCQERKATAAECRFGPTRRSPHTKHAKDTVLGGKFVCASCGGFMRVIKSPSLKEDAPPAHRGIRIACSNGNFRGACDHRRSYDLGKLEDGVLDFVKQRASRPEFVQRLLKGAMAEHEEQKKKVLPELRKTQQERDKVEYQIDRIDTAILESDEPIPRLIEKRKTLKTLLIGLKEKIEILSSGGANVSLHPETIKRFCTDLTEIHAALTGPKLEPDDAERFKVRFRNVFDRVIVYPTEKRQDYEFEPRWQLVALSGIQKIKENQCNPSSGNCSIQSGTGSSRPPGIEQTFSLGRWQRAA